MEYFGIKYTNFGSLLKDLRLKKDFSQMELAEIIGVSQQSITSYESNSRIPSVKIASKYASTLGIEEDIFHRLRLESILKKDKQKVNNQLENKSINECDELYSILHMSEIDIEHLISFLKIDGRIITKKELEKVTEYLRVLRIIKNKK